jgi:TonB family protein
MALATATGIVQLRTLSLGCAALLLAGCASTIRPPVARAPAPVIVTPVDVTTTYIATYGHHYAHGQYAVVQVCVAPDGAIASTRIVISSAQKNFDESALTWARQAHYQPQRENGQPVYGCQEVRVEINVRRDNSVGRGADSALG